MRYRVIPLCSLFFLSGCLVGPTYKTPLVKFPVSYSEQRCAEVTADLGCWWTFFEDHCLDDLIEKAIKNNYDLRIAIEKIAEMRADYQIKAANLYPEIDMIAAVNRTKYSSNVFPSAVTTAPAGTAPAGSTSSSTVYSYYNFGLDAWWEIDFWGKLRHAKAGAYDEYQAQIESARDVYLILLGDVARTYVEIRALQKDSELREQEVALEKRLLALTCERLCSGVASEIPDVQQVEAVDAAKSRLLIVRTALTQAIIRLAVLLGENPEEFVLCSGARGVPMSKKMLEVGLPSDLLRRRPDIRQAERQLAAATEYVGQAIAQWFPSFSLLGGIAPESNSVSTWFTQGGLTWSIGPIVRWPVFNFGRINFNIDAKKSVERQAQLAYAKSVVYALGDVENWLVTYFNEKKVVRVLQEKLTAATRERYLNQALFAAGLVNETAFLQSEKNCIEVELELIDAQMALSSAFIAVYKALGGGW